ncbi:MAG: extracellular solute-binding protein [Magnetococcus sp. WYHC-3]
MTLYSKGVSTFQAVIFGIAILAIVGGVVAFANFRSRDERDVDQVTVWGTVDRVKFGNLTSFLVDEREKINVSYIQKDLETFESELVEALADGVGPDVVLLRDDMIYSNRNRIQIISKENMSIFDFKKTFVTAGEVFLNSEGIGAIPFMVDPLITYWNRTLFSRGSIPSAPEYWDELITMVEKLAIINEEKEISKSAVALGEYRNITNSKEILVSLIMQAGNNLVTEDEEGNINVILGVRGNEVLQPSEAALNFYAQFANPSKTIYTWNRSMAVSQNAFTAGDLAIYFGFASELSSLRLKNPNLDFDIATFPQSRDSGRNITFGRVYGFAITNNAKSFNNAFSAIKILTSQKSVNKWSEIESLPPVRRDLLGTVPGDSVSPVFYKSALWAKSFLDLDSSGTDKIFQDMIESFVSGRAKDVDAVGRATQEMMLFIDQ